VHTDRFGVPATINFELILEDAADVGTAEKVLSSALAALGEGPDMEAVEGAKAKLRVQWYRRARDTSALAFDIGHFQTMDRWQTLEAHLNARELVSPDDIARLAKAYFLRDNLSVGIAMPDSGSQALSMGGAE
jgi:predicted Zn-dependent peptidase